MTGAFQVGWLLASLYPERNAEGKAALVTMTETAQAEAISTARALIGDLIHHANPADALALAGHEYAP